MNEQGVPDGVPLTQREWDRMSEASRRWIAWAATAMKEKARKLRGEAGQLERVVGPPAEEE